MLWQIGDAHLALNCIFMIKMIPGITVQFQIHSFTLFCQSGLHANNQSEKM